LKRAGITITDQALYSCGDFSTSNYMMVYITASDQLALIDYQGAVIQCQRVTAPIFRDASAWYHVVVIVDTTLGSGSRLKIYVNGVLQALTGTEYGASGGCYADYYERSVGNRVIDNTGYTDGYLAEFHFIDGQALTVDDFGEIKNGIWVPKSYSGTYGATGFYLDFSNSSHFGEDQSGNGNDFTDSGLDTNDQVLDTPTENWCVLNSTLPQTGTFKSKFSNGNLDHYIDPADIGVGCGLGTMVLTSGKWYWELNVVVIGGTEIYPGITQGDIHTPGPAYDTLGSAMYVSNGTKYVNQTPSAYGVSYTAGDVVGFALDVDAQTLECFKNNVSQGEIDLSATDPGNGWTPGISDGTGSAGGSITRWDFGQHGFVYTPPTDFQAINFTNVTAALALDENKYLEGNKGFDTSLYLGTGAEKSITDLEFSPDFVWIKSRDNTFSHHLFDTVRGATNFLKSNSTNIEASEAQSLKSFDNRGFTLGTIGGVNQSGENHVAWSWKESPDYGFDIASWTGNGNSIIQAHNLGVVPEMIIMKNRDRESDGNWWTYHQNIGSGVPEDYFLQLQVTNAEAFATTVWDSTPPTSSVFSVHLNRNIDGDKIIAYLFASIPGFSKVFSYTGNSADDGPLVNLGFRPRYIMLKDSTTPDNWMIHDTARDPYNYSPNVLFANLANGEAPHVDYHIDIVSNGFKIRTAGVSHNELDSLYIGIAFAETPFPWANAR
jgi:hypothetical protein